MLENKQIQKP